MFLYIIQTRYYLNIIHRVHYYYYASWFTTTNYGSNNSPNKLPSSIDYVLFMCCIRPFERLLFTTFFGSLPVLPGISFPFQRVWRFLCHGLNRRRIASFPRLSVILESDTNFVALTKKIYFILFNFSSYKFIFIKKFLKIIHVTFRPDK